MTDTAFSVLFLCTGNSARSQIGEALLRSLSRGRIDVSSAGTSPQAEVHPMARQILYENYGIDISAARPKPVDMFLNRRFDVVITVCDDAAEACPSFPNAAQQLHWSFEDPAAVPAVDQRRAFEEVATGMLQRLQLWLALPAIALRLDPSAG